MNELGTGIWQVSNRSFVFFPQAQTDIYCIAIGILQNSNLKMSIICMILLSAESARGDFVRDSQYHWHHPSVLDGLDRSTPFGGSRRQRQERSVGDSQDSCCMLPRLGQHLAGKQVGRGEAGACFENKIVFFSDFS